MNAAPDRIESQLIPYNHAGKWGFCNAEREIVIPCEYDQTLFFQDDLAIVRNGVAYADWHYGVINRLGEVVVPLEYSHINRFSEGLASARRFGKAALSFLDTSGNIRIHAAFQTAHSFSEGLAYVESLEHKKLTRRGFINTSGEYEIDRTSRFLESCTSDFQEGIAIMEFDMARGTFYSYLLRNGLPLRDSNGEYFFLNAAPFVNGIAGVWDESGAFRLINSRGETVFDAGFAYDNCSGEIHDGLLRVRKGKNRGFIDATGREVIPCMIDFFSIENFYEGLAKVQYDEHGAFGYVDKKLNSVIPPQFETAQDFSEGLACVQRGGLYGFINTDGEEVIPLQYNYAGDFGSYEVGFAWVRKNGLTFFIDREGREYGSV